MFTSELLERFYENPKEALLQLKEYYDLDKDVSFPALVAEENLTELVPTLFQQGYDLNKCGDLFRDYGGGRYKGYKAVHPLEAALIKKNYATAKALFQNGSNLNDPKIKGQIWYPLMRFSMDGDYKLEEIRFMLYELSADPNIADNGNRTPLLEAATWGHVKTCDLLLCYGANPNSQERYFRKDDPCNGRTPFMAAIMGLYTEVIRLFIDKANIDYSLCLHYTGRDVFSLIQSSSDEIKGMVLTDMQRKGFDVDALAKREKKFEIEANRGKEFKTELSQVKDNLSKYSLTGTLIKCSLCSKDIAYGELAGEIWKHYNNFKPCSQCGQMSGNGDVWAD